MAPAPAPAPEESNTGRTIAIAVPVSIAIAIFCLGILAGTCWMYRRQKQRLDTLTKDMEIASMAASHKHVLPDPSGYSDGMLLDMPPAKPVPMSATYDDVDHF